MNKPKPFAISKHVVWEAYQRVKANGGAAGIDGASIAEFETDLKGNLYKLWNRMSSGSYFPQPVRMVEIPKRDGQGVRVLGVPTVTDRIAQTVAKQYLEPQVEPVFHPDSMATGRGGPRCRLWRSAGNAAGRSTGSSTWTFVPSLTRWITNSSCERYGSIRTRSGSSSTWSGG